MMKDFLNIEDKYILVLCMFISFMVWLVNRLSETYTIETPVKINYHNFPADKVLISNAEDTLYLTMETLGSTLLWEMFWPSGLATTNIDLKYIRPPILKTTRLGPEIQQQLPTSRITQIKPDELHFEFAKKASKKIPVQLVANITTRKGFEIKYKGKKIEPDSVEVSGPQNVVDTIVNWQTQTLFFNDLLKGVSGKLDLKSGNKHSLTFKPPVVDYLVEVEEYTTKTLEIPVVIENLPEEANVYLYPSLAKVEFQLGLSDFDFIKEGYFRVTADFSEVDLANSQKVALRITEAPEEPRIKNLRVSPRFSDFIIIE